jgi:hypothetical protein
MKKYLTQKNAIILGIILFSVLVGILVYRMFFEFKTKNVNDYIKEEADKYPGNEKEVSSVLKDGVHHILSSYSLTNQVCKNAKANGTPKEQELVHSAIMQCKAYGYLD